MEIKSVEKRVHQKITHIYITEKSKTTNHKKIHSRFLSCFFFFNFSWLFLWAFYVESHYYVSSFLFFLKNKYKKVHDCRRNWHQHRSPIIIEEDCLENRLVYSVILHCSLSSTQVPLFLFIYFSCCFWTIWNPTAYKNHVLIYVLL